MDPGVSEPSSTWSGSAYGSSASSRRIGWCVASGAKHGISSPSLQLDSGGGTGGTAERAGVGGGGTGQGTTGYQLALAERPVPPGTLLGTTLPEHFPFEYHLYRLYPAGEGGSPQTTVRPRTRRGWEIDADWRSARPSLSRPSSGSHRREPCRRQTMTPDWAAERRRGEAALW